MAKPGVYDASALLALVLDEPGAERARISLSEGVISSVNLSEVIATLVSRGATSADVSALIEDLPLEVMPFTTADAETAGLLRFPTKAFGLSLGDRACLAVGRRLKAQILTADRAWEKLSDVLTEPLELIR